MSIVWFLIVSQYEVCMLVFNCIFNMCSKQLLCDDIVVAHLSQVTRLSISVCREDTVVFLIHSLPLETVGTTGCEFGNLILQLLLPYKWTIIITSLLEIEYCN